MATNDSDSSEEASFITTNILLGYASKQPTDDTFSQLGGYPRWLSAADTPPAELGKCKICGNNMIMLLQLNGDLPEVFVGHERKLYIFGCKRKACSRKNGVIRAFRGIRISKSKGKGSQTSNAKATESKMERPREQQSISQIGDSLFSSTFQGKSSNANSFSTTATPAKTQNPFAPMPNATSTPTSLASKPPQTPSTDLPSTFADKARISTPPQISTTKEPWPPHSALPKPYPSYHLDADYESLEPEKPSSSKAAMDIDTETSNSRDEKDAFESTIDKTFQKFADRLAQNPEQVLRYEFGGAPLLYSKNDAVGKLFAPLATSLPNSNVKTVSRGAAGIPRCQNCASPRVFELQLVPQAIAELEVEEEGLEGMEWGTIMLGVCEKDCGERGVADGDLGWVEEWVGVQWEEAGEMKGSTQ
ncbi:hypothetical protein ACLMJK_000096 [Lecanora helva]